MAFPLRVATVSTVALRLLLGRLAYLVGLVLVAQAAFLPMVRWGWIGSSDERGRPQPSARVTLTPYACE